jgi:hypothetical protein
LPAVKFGRLLVGLVLAIVCAAGCANPEYDAGAAHDELVRAGLTEEQASCVTDGLRTSFFDRRLRAHAEPTEREVEKMLGVLEECEVEGATDADRSS